MIGTDMIKQGTNKILNVSSTAGYMPDPIQVRYFTTKAFVSSFFQAIVEEFNGKGVTVTRMKPSAIATEFFETADLRGTKLSFKSASTNSVIKISYGVILEGKQTGINDIKLKFLLDWVMLYKLGKI